MASFGNLRRAPVRFESQDVIDGFESALETAFGEATQVLAEEIARLKHPEALEGYMEYFAAISMEGDGIVFCISTDENDFVTLTWDEIVVDVLQNREVNWQATRKGLQTIIDRIDAALNS